VIGTTRVAGFTSFYDDFHRNDEALTSQHLSLPTNEANVSSQFSYVDPPLVAGKGQFAKFFRIQVRYYLISNSSIMSSRGVF
jgi:hypothetical protein